MLALAGCARNVQDPLDPQGPIAREIYDLSKPVFLVAVAIFVLVEGLLVFALVRFRSRGDERPVQTHGNARLEIAWTLIPALLLAFVAVPTVLTIFSIARTPSGDVLEIKVTGNQWWWDYEYQGLNVRTANELHIPVDRPVRLSLASADVIHSYWVPKLAGKQDVIPGRINYLTLRADKPGEDYYGQCAEFCALSHANMRLRVFTHTEADFDEWVAEQQRDAATPTSALARQGERTFMQGQCANCHAIKGTDAKAKTGPDLTHFASRRTFGGASFDNTPENVARWLRDPPAMKPGSKMPNYHLSEDEISSLVAYLESLR